MISGYTFMYRLQIVMVVLHLVIILYV